MRHDRTRLSVSAAGPEAFRARNSGRAAKSATSPVPTGRVRVHFSTSLFASVNTFIRYPDKGARERQYPGGDPKFGCRYCCGPLAGRQRASFRQASGERPTSPRQAGDKRPVPPAWQRGLAGACPKYASIAGP